MDAGVFPRLDAKELHMARRADRSAVQTRRHDSGARKAMSALSLPVTATDFRGPDSVILNPPREDVAGKTQTALIVLLWASAALLLIACVNPANLWMSRGAVR